MKIQKVQPNLNFEAQKRRFISLESHEQLKDILQKMNNEAQYKSNEYSFESDYITHLNLKNDKVQLIDTRHYLKKQPENKQLIKETLFTIGKTELVISNKTGEIIDYYKPLFTRWSNIMKKIDNYLLEFNNNYHKQDVVSKSWFGIKGFTEKGLQKLQGMLVK